MAESGEGDSGKWILRNVSGYTKVTSLLDDTLSLALENQDSQNRVELDEAPDSWYSAHFTLNSTRFDYDIYPDKIVDGPYTMTADSGKELHSTYENNTWKLTEDISGLPQFTAENMPISEALYNMALQESLEDIFTETSVHTGERSKYSILARTGTRSGRVIRRCLFSILWRGRSRSSPATACYRRSKATRRSGWRIPVPVVRIQLLRIVLSLAMAAWETYLATRDPGIPGKV